VLRVGLAGLLALGGLLAIPVAQAASEAVYAVRRGDNLTLIGRRFGCSVSELKRANGLASDVIQVGQKLRIHQPFRRTKAREIAWQRPLARGGEILREFGPYKEAGVLMPRTGTDVACAVGTEVRAPAHGVVRHVGEMDGIGTLVILEHGGDYSTVLAPLQEPSIRWEVGDAILAGDAIGRVGPPEDGDRPYLHIELRRKDKAVEPDRLIH
jgi:murein DD-endopeptidase MepM/ murein hydrolase activator NlpD